MKNTIAQLSRLVSEVPKKLQVFSLEDMTQHPSPGKWSKKEILGHLSDSALHNWQRFLYAQNQPDPLKINNYPQDDLVHLNNYQHLPTAQIVELWANLNRQIMAVIKNLPKEKYAHPIVLPRGNVKTLEWLIKDYLVHLEHHLKQIFSENIVPKKLPEKWLISQNEAIGTLANHPGSDILATLLEQGEMYVEIYAPNKTDHQVAHDQDEIYLVISGSGIFYNNGERRPFQSGDLIFVPAGIEHRFEDFTEDFKTWVIFY